MQKIERSTNGLKSNKRSYYFKISITFFCAAFLLFSSIATSITIHVSENEKKKIESYVHEVELINTAKNMFFPDISQRDVVYRGNTGLEPWYGYVGGIINSANGNLYLLSQDLTITGRGFNLQIARSYNSYNKNYTDQMRINLRSHILIKSNSIPKYNHL